MFRGNESLEIGQIMMLGISFVSQGATNQVYWRGGMASYLVVNIEKNLGEISTLLTKREC